MTTTPKALPAKWHELKTDPDVFDAVVAGTKTHEIRYNDRDFKVGDGLWLRKTLHAGERMRVGAPLVYTGDECRRVVSHVLEGYGLRDGWVILSLEPIADSLASADGVEVVAWWNTKWSLGATIRELSEHPANVEAIEETPAYKAGELVALVRQSAHLAALSKEREVADGLAEVLRKLKRIDEEGLYREEIVFEGTARYAVDVAAVDELSALIDAALTAHRESRGAASEAKEG